MVRLTIVFLAIAFASLAGAQVLDDAEKVPWTETFPLIGWPQGDASAGRTAFVDLKCYQCHAVPSDSELLELHEGHGPGPELPAHEAPVPRVLLLRQIVAPGSDKAAESHMGNFADVMTVQQLTDLIGFLEELPPRAP